MTLLSFSGLLLVASVRFDGDDAAATVLEYL